MNTDVKRNHFDFEAEVKKAHEKNLKIVITGLVIGGLLAALIFAIV